MRESLIERHFAEQCKIRGIMTLKMSAMHFAGIPDRLVLHKGVCGFAEIKAPNKKPRTLQILQMEKLRNAGFFVDVVDSKESALAWISVFEEHVNEMTRQFL